MARVPEDLGRSFRELVRTSEEDPLYHLIDEHLVIEKTGWAPESCERAAARLNAVRAPALPLKPVVFWFREAMAFTTDGAFVYLTRRLVEKLRFEDAIAFVLAHEMAHHDLGHVPDAARANLPERLVSLARHWLRSEDRERDADDRAIELCEKAGYERERCLQAFDVLLQISLDHRDLDGALGTDGELEPKGGDTPKPTLLSRLVAILERRSHPPVYERRKRLRKNGP